MRRLGVLLLVGVLVAAGCAGGSGDGGGGDGGAAPPTSSPETVAASGCGGDADLGPGTARLTLDDEGTSREVERVIPPGYDGERPHPLILSLHGFTSTIEQQDLFSALPERAAERGYVLLTPQGVDATLPVGDEGEEVTGPFWNVRPDESGEVVGAQDDLGFLTGLIETTIAELCIDPDRVYVTGNSNGAGMAAALACALPGRLAAIAPVSGINLAPPCPDLAPVSVVAFHGDADPLVSYEGERAAGVELGNPPVEEAVAAFARAAGCADEPTVSPLFDDVVRRRWVDCRPGLEVELFTVLGGGHTWPGMLNHLDPEALRELAEGMDLPAAAGVDVAAIAGHMTRNLDATAVMLDFFDAHTARGPASPETTPTTDG